MLNLKIGTKVLIKPGASKSSGASSRYDGKLGTINGLFNDGCDNEEHYGVKVKPINGHIDTWFYSESELEVIR